MKSVKLLYVLALFFSLALFQSCKDDPCEGVNCLNDGICIDGTCDCPTGYSGITCESYCIDDIVGIWNRSSGECGCVSSFEFTKGSSQNEMQVTMAFIGVYTQYFTGIGMLSSDCSKLTYTLELNGSISSPIVIIFNGTKFTIEDFEGCTFEAKKN